MTRAVRRNSAVGAAVAERSCDARKYTAIAGRADFMEACYSVRE